MKDLRRSILVLLILCTILTPIITTATTEAVPHITLDDEQEKEEYTNRDVQFVWTLYRNETVDHIVWIEALPELDWSYSISETHFLLDSSNPHEMVKLTFRIPTSPSRDSMEATVRFHYRVLGTDERFSEDRSVTINVKGVAPAPESNTIVGGLRNPLPAPLDNPYGAFILNLAIWFIIGYVFYFLVSPIIHSFTKKTKTNVDEVIIKMVRKPLLVLIFIYGLIESLLRLNLRLGVRATIYQIYLLAVVILGVFVTYKIVLAVLEELMKEKGGPNSAFGTVLKPVLEKVVGAILLIGGLIMVFHILGVQVTALLAGAGVAGLVIAFAAQDTLANFFSGMHLLLDRPFKIGDIILLETGEYCRIENIGLRSTKLYNIRDHEGIVLPNNNLANQKIVNIVQPDSTIRAAIEVGVAYGSDIKKVKEILHQVAEEHPDVLKHGIYRTNVRFKNFADSSLDFSLRVWVNEVVKQWEVTSDLREAIDRRFREEGIEIPFPQRTVWLHKLKDDG